MFRLVSLLLLGFFSSVFAEEQANPFVGLRTDIPIAQIDGTELRINIALPKNRGETSRPVMVLVHGGGLIKGNKKRFNKRISKLAEKGIVAASVMYRLAPENRFPTAIEDVQLAIRYLKSNASLYNLNPNRIVINGASAGAYLAVMVGVLGNEKHFSRHGLFTDVDSSVRAVITQSPAVADYTLLKYRDFPIVKRFRRNKGADLNQSLAEMSPVTYLDKNDPPIFIAHGSIDKLVPVDMSREFVAILKVMEHDYEYIEVQGGGHSLNKTRPQKASEVFKASMAFFNKNTLSE